MKIILLITLSTFIFALDTILPIKIIKYDEKKANIGKILFFDTMLSKDKTVSCASCHLPNHGWADNKKVSIGVYNKQGKINSPTILNSVNNFKQLWNGKIDNLIDQAKGPLHNNFEMDMSVGLLEQRLNQNTEYKTMFKNIYHKESVQYADVLDAIAEFEKSLVTPDSKFDLFLKKKKTLSADEQKGYNLFKMYGCITCHNGINVGGNSFQKIGIVIPYDNCFQDRFDITKKEFDKCVYKVPTLRNIILTSPYFHDGSAKTIDDAIKKMAYHNLGFEIEDKDIKYIKIFLKTLTGTLPTSKENK